jgi:hypothetical protein
MTWIKVSLQGTDDEIIKNFQTWLTEYRKEINYFSKEKSFTNKTLAGWIKDRLLSYIDLSIITKYETNQQLEHHVAAQLIFPDEYDVNVPDRIRKTIKPKAKLLVSEKILSAMQAQLANSPT